MPEQSHYTFGDTDLAAERLRHLAETYAQSSRALLGRLGPISGGAVDLGCGPGHTTALLVEVLRPAWAAGLERSARLLAQASTASVSTWAASLGISCAAGLAVEEEGAVPSSLPAQRMAQLHAMNLRTWGADPYARTAFDGAELAELKRALGLIAAGHDPAPPVQGEMGQAVGRRRS